MHTYLAILSLSILSISVPVKAVTMDSSATRLFHSETAQLELTQTKERGSGRVDNNTKERGSGRITPKPDNNAKSQILGEIGQKQCERGSGRCDAQV
ncbi:MAG: hypothetical protein SAJ12_02545 [Jaaginema sp. PMC 1079.18]|nr:hypothetical protein [Jaaginema sp. PMC 1080.18]MEC4849868.1 hypothetical protein [Jaaginema sp. PMC 1079.18]MEC4866857.1 hypothetical protein [Jaaginema sp. PMC 1078.18]